MSENVSGRPNRDALLASELTYTALGFLVTLYATLITLFGLAWVLFLIGMYISPNSAKKFRYLPARTADQQSPQQQVG
jgi:hypothetical protein